MYVVVRMTTACGPHPVPMARARQPRQQSAHQPERKARPRRSPLSFSLYYSHNLGTLTVTLIRIACNMLHFYCVNGSLLQASRVLQAPICPRLHLHTCPRPNRGTDALMMILPPFHRRESPLHALLDLAAECLGSYSKRAVMTHGGRKAPGPGSIGWLLDCHQRGQTAARALGHRAAATTEPCRACPPSQSGALNPPFTIKLDPGTQ